MRPLPRPRAFAFDLDGTLIDSRRDIAAACNHVLVSAGRSPLDEAAIGAFVGDGARALLARAFGVARRCGREPDVARDPCGPELEAWHEEFVRYYAAHPVTHTRWMPGALDALEALAAFPCAVVTNKTRTVTLAILDALAARSRFAAIYGGGDGPLKPRPEPILEVARAMGAEAGAVWVVGDAVQDIGAARAAGSQAIAVLGGFQSEERLRAAAPDRVIASLSELPALVASANVASS